MPGYVAPSVGFPDGAMIPSMVAQAMQVLFRFREVTNPKRPLRDDLDNELLREFLRSGDLVATTFYGPVRFNGYGQNVGRGATTLQVRGGVARIVVRPAGFQADVDALNYPAPSFADCPEDAHERKYEHTACLLCAASTCDTSTVWQRFAGGFIVSVVSGVAGVALLAVLARLGYRHHQHYLKALKAKQEQHQNNIQRLQSAVEKVATLEFYVCFIRFEDLKAHGKLLSHEVVREKNQLTILDTFADVKTFIDANQVAFISHQVAFGPHLHLALARTLTPGTTLALILSIRPHPPQPTPPHPLPPPPSPPSPSPFASQWLAGHSPDPENVHFKGIIDAVTALQSRLIREDDPKADAPFYVWLDYISIPQANKTLQSLSISSLALYASMPDYFVVVAPPATHTDKQCACDKETYLRRGWCVCVPCLSRQLE